MTPFLTVKEAAQLVHKSPSSIRRIIHPIIKSEQHPDRELIQPDVQEALELRLKGDSFAWRISEELLRRKVLSDDPSTAGSKAEAAGKPSSAKGDGALLSMLERELSIKNGQIQQQAELIAKQMQLIEGLGERLREGNILIGSLQQRLALPYSKPRQDATDAPVESPAVKPTKAPSKSPPKKPKRWFSW